MTITAIVRMTAAPGQRQALREFIAPALDATAAHPECSSVEVLGCLELDDTLILIERWTSVAAHQEFIGGVIASGSLDGLETLLAEEMETLHYSESD